MIGAQDLAVSFDGVPALGPVSLRVDRGERVLLLGASGSGKSTLLAALAGVLHADPDGEPGAELGTRLTGSVRVEGTAGLMHQDPSTQTVMATIERDVAFGPENLAVPREEIVRRIPEALADAGVGGLDPHRSTGELSGGQQQRVGLAGLLAMAPEVLLLDEPTANLDPEGVRDVAAAVRAAADARGLTFVVVEHHVDAWLPHITRVIVLGEAGSERTVLADGPPEEIFSAEHPVRSVLEDAGIWLPGQRAGLSAARAAAAVRAPAAAGTAVPAPDAARAPLLAARDLSVSRQPVARQGLRHALTPASRRRWDTQRGRVPVQERLGFEVFPGEALAITGRNGAGKSTLALTLSGLLAPYSGAVEYAPELTGELAGTPSWLWQAPELIQRIGSVFQNPEHQFITASVREELEFGPRLAGWEPERIAVRTEELLGLLGLERHADQQPFTLSGGQKRRLSVASAMAAQPSILIVDEPTFGQDARTWGHLMDLFRGFADAESAVIAVTHDEQFIAGLGARVLELTREEAA